MSNTPPTVTAAASAVANPVTGTTASLSVRADDDGGEAQILYTWSAVSVPSGAATPTFSVSGTNAAKDTTVTFSRTGVYRLCATIADAENLSAQSTVDVNVAATLSGLLVSPASVLLATGETQQFSAAGYDQFGVTIAAALPLTWTADSGAIGAGGLFTAAASAGSATITAASGTVTGLATVWANRPTHMITTTYLPDTLANAAPLARDHYVSVVADTPTRTPQVTLGAYDVESDVLSVSSFSSPSHGSVALNADNTFTYAPAAGYVGGDAFSFTLSDGRGGRSTATMHISVAQPTGRWGVTGFTGLAEVQAGGATISFSNSTMVPRVTDWDGNGLTDLLVGVAGNVWLYRNVGSAAAPSFAAGVKVQAAGSAIQVGTGRVALSYVDMNLDGKKDLVVVGTSDRKARLYRNTSTGIGDPTFAAAALLQSSSGGSYVLADIRADIADWNGDGLPDIITGSFSGSVKVAYNVGVAASPAFGTPTTTLDAAGLALDGSYNLNLRIVDVNQDGVADLVDSYNWGNINYRVNTGLASQPILPNAAQYTVTDAAGAAVDFHALADGPIVDFADFNGDGRIDLVAGGELGGKIRIAYGQGTGLDSLNQIRAIVAAHPVDLGAYLDGDATAKSGMQQLQGQLYDYVASSPNPVQKQAIFAGLLDLIRTYPQYFRVQTLDLAKQPGIPSLAAQVWLTALLVDYYSPANRTALADAAQFTGGYRELLEEQGVLYAENNRNPGGAEAFWQWLRTIPHDLAGGPNSVYSGSCVTANDWLGGRVYLVRGALKNTFDGYPSDGGEYGFGSDAPAVIGERGNENWWMTVMHHEASHDIDAFVNRVADLRRRWGQTLVLAAGHDAGGANYVQADLLTGWYSESLTKTYWQQQGWWNGTDPWRDVTDSSGTVIAAGVYDTFFRSGLGASWDDYGFMRGSVNWFLYTAQESLATQGNQYWNSTEGRIEVALDRWRRGFTSDITEVLLFMDIWSLGQNKLKTFENDTDCNQVISFAGLHRNAYGYIDQLAVNGHTYQFVVDNKGVVTAVQSSPRPVDDQLLLDYGSWTSGDVRSNDVDADNDPLAVAAWTQPAHGTVTYNNDGTFTFTPGGSFQGADSFSYTVTDPAGTSGTATVTVLQGHCALLESWYEIGSSTAVSALTSNARYPASPDETALVYSFEGPVDHADSYGERIQALLTPPTSGSYRFWIASDDNGELWMSTTASPAGASRIAYVSGWTDSRQWTKYSQQRSASVNLVAGQQYYLMAIMKEGGGGDNLAVAWQGPGINQAVIPGAYLQPYTGNQPPTVASAAHATLINHNSQAVLSVLGADDKGERELLYSWATTGTPPAPVTFSANGTNAAKDLTATFSKPGVYDFAVTIADPAGFRVASSISVVVLPTLTTIAVSPASPTVTGGQTQLFSAVGSDQFGAALAPQPSFAWSLDSGSGTINAAGLYTAPAQAGTATVRATSGAVSGTATVSITAPVAHVTGRHLFYNHSIFDGNEPAANSQDYNAIAPPPSLIGHGHADGFNEHAKELGKQALLPGQTANFTSYSSYARGLNGILLAFDHLADPAGLSLADFAFRVGNDNAPAQWCSAPAPLSIRVEQDVVHPSFAGQPDVVTLIWADEDPYTPTREAGAISNEWLQVTVLANAHTGLASADVFYFGNQIGESGDSPSDANVDQNDEIGARNHPHTAFNAAPISDPYDLNRDGKVDQNDEILARNHPASAFSRLALLAPPAPLQAQGESAASTSADEPLSAARVATVLSKPVPRAGIAPLGGIDDWDVWFRRCIRRPRATLAPVHDAVFAGQELDTQV